MSTWYVDLVNGNDSNGGTSWVDAKLTTDAVTSAMLAPGDTVKVAKSPDCTTLAAGCSITNKSRTVTLPAAVTANIDLCEATTNWNGGRDITETISTIAGSSAKLGSNYIKAGSTSYGTATGEFAYIDLGASTDLSAYQQISFWMVASNSWNTSVAGDIQIKLYSDTGRATLLTTLNLPIMRIYNQFMSFTLDNGSALPNNVRQISFVKNTATNYAGILSFDNIIACKAPSSADSLTLDSLISVSSSNGYGQRWYPIKSINGTDVEIDNQTGAGATTGTGLYETTNASITLYKREPFCKYNASNGIYSSEVGTAAAHNTYSGGWDTVTDTQDGMTYISLNGSANTAYLGISSQFYCDYDHFGFVRCYSAINAGLYITISYCDWIGNQFSFYSLPGVSEFNNCTFINNMSLAPNTIGYWVTFNSCIIQGNIQYSTIMGMNIVMNNCQFNYDNYIIVSGTVQFNSCQAADSIYTSYWLYVTNVGMIEVNNCTYTTTALAAFSLGSIYDARDQGVANNNYFYQGFPNTASVQILAQQNTTVHTAGGYAWSQAPVSNYCRSSAPFDIDLVNSYIPCKSGQTLTVSVWCKKDHATAIIGQLVLKGGQIAGVTSDVIATCPSDTTWDQLTITFTPTEDGSVYLTWRSYFSDTDTTYTYKVYWDDISIS